MPTKTQKRDSKQGYRKKASKRILVHGFRIALFVCVLWLIRNVHQNTVWNDAKLESNSGALEFVKQSLPKAFEIRPATNETDGNRVSNHLRETIGSVLQTSPQSDHIIGYSGPTNCLILLGTDGKIRSVEIANSGDTVDHVKAVELDPEFLNSFRGIRFGESERWKQIDAVSGATLTSYSIISSIANRMGESAPSLKFDAKPNFEKLLSLWEFTARAEPTGQPGIWDVYRATGDESKIGFVLSTSPAADHLSGYQGPTKTLAGFDSEGKCVGLIVDQTFENQPYASYVDDDFGFQKIYQGKTITEIASLAPEENGIDGVSGATMTSVCIAEGIMLAAKKAMEERESVSNFAGRSFLSWWADILTVLLTVIGVGLSFNRNVKHKSIRVAYQVAVIAFLGFINGHMLSQASIVGWSKSAVPWTVAPGLVFLSLAALAVPMFSKRQPYCHHICPFGALQQLTIKRPGWKIKIPKWLDRALSLIPYALLLLVVCAAMSKSNFNLASIEPFDGFAFRVAGWATISVFAIGLVFSLVSPMAYCRYGCPTGALLGFLRFRADSARIGTRDWAAMLLLVLAISLGF